MLVMYTLNNSVASKLPPTSYVKLIDVWLLFGLVLPFFITILLIVIEHLPQPKDNNTIFVDSAKAREEKRGGKSGNSLQRFSRVHLPMLELAFLILYGSVALYVWNNNL